MKQQRFWQDGRFWGGMLAGLIVSKLIVWLDNGIRVLTGWGWW